MHEAERGRGCVTTTSAATRLRRPENSLLDGFPDLITSSQKVAALNPRSLLRWKYSHQSQFSLYSILWQPFEAQDRQRCGPTIPSTEESTRLSPMKMEQFRYTTSLQDSQEMLTIRVIDLLPGTGDSQIECQLRHVSLLDNPAYEAISHCWGVDPPSETIQCDRLPLLITKSLHGALHQFRDPDRVRTLWADAICINQGDVEEKSSQVTMMGKIYSQATGVRVWLGPATETSTRGMALIQELVDLAHQHSEKYAAPMSQIRDLKSPQWLRARFPQGMASSETHWRPFFLLCSNPWFRRAWVVQEVALSYARARLCCGDITVPWSDFVIAVFFSQYGLTYGWGAQDDYALARISGNRVLCLGHTSAEVALDVEAGGNGLGLLWLLEINRSASATDPRDKVYSVLGMARNHGFRTLETLIIPDYRLDTATLYQQVSELFLDKFQTLYMPAHATMFPHDATGHKLDLPSWVTDWSCPLNSVPGESSNLDTILEIGSPGLYNACLIDQYPKVYKVDGRVLVLSGLILDEITAVGPLFDFDSLRAQYPKVHIGLLGMLSISMLHRISQMWQCALKKAYPHTGEESLEALLKTIFRGHLPQMITSAGTGRDVAAALLKLARRASLLQESFLSRSPYILTQGLDVIVSRARESLTPVVISEVLSAMFTMVTFATVRGYMCQCVSPEVRLGDRIALIRGACQPMIVRPRSDGGWTRIGEAYVHGIMNGEAFDINQCREIRIV